MVDLSPRQVAVAGVQTQPVEPRGLTKEIRAVGKLEFNEKGLARVSARIAGRVDKLYVDFTGAHVVKGQKLLEIYSPELLSTQQEILLALKTRERVRESPLPEVLEGANSLLAAARRRLLLWGISEKQIAELELEGQARIHMTVYSPARGTVIEKQVIEGQYVATGDVLYKIADLSTIWLFAEVYESELGMVKVGLPVDITIPSYPGRAFSGRVSFINPVLEGQTRTAKVRVDLPNAHGLLKPQMFAQATLKVPIGAALLAVPTSSIVDTGANQYAWVETGPGQYERRQVRIGAEVNGFYPVVSGLTKGEKVVTAANFLVDSQAQLKAGAAAGGHGGHGGH
ncbi:MAG: efflux RND transporter periplasmic adaptor subunit [Actinomycetota bacterium]